MIEGADPSGGPHPACGPLFPPTPSPRVFWACHFGLPENFQECPSEPGGVLFHCSALYLERCYGCLNVARHT